MNAFHKFEDATVYQPTDQAGLRVVDVASDNHDMRIYAPSVDSDPEERKT